jgi:hypothetical protein
LTQKRAAPQDTTVYFIECGNGEAPGYDHVPQRFIIIDSLLIGRRRPHAEFDRTVNHGECLSRTVDKPPFPGLAFFASSTDHAIPQVLC